MTQKIFFHTGLSKTGSTFLQKRVFPNLPGIFYIPTVRFRKVLGLIPALKEDKILVSREFDQQFELEIKKFSAVYPDAYSIIVFREPSSWAVSNFKRFVKNGHPISFSEFIDIQNDTGIFKIKDFRYSRYISLLEAHFTQSPLILIYEDLKKNPELFLQEIADYTGTDISKSKFNLTPSHVSYDENALKLVRKAASKINFQKKLEIHTHPVGFLYNLYANVLRYIILYGGRLLPSALISQDELFNLEEVDQVKNYFADEWKSTLEKARKN